MLLDTEVGWSIIPFVLNLFSLDPQNFLIWTVVMLVLQSLRKNCRFTGVNRGFLRKLWSAMIAACLSKSSEDLGLY